MTFWQWLSLNPFWGLTYLVVIGIIVVSAITAVRGRR